HYSDPDGGVLTAITVLQLPVNGTLKLSGSAVTAGQSIPAGNLASLSYEPALDASGVETFTWSANNFFGPATAATVSLNILVPSPQIVIIKDPESQAVNPGAPVTFSVTAISTLPLTYQWRKDGTPINTATAATFNIPSAAESDEGDYDVIVTNSADQTTSGAATLSVNDPVNFTH